MTSRTKRTLWLVLRLLVSAVCVGWVAAKIQWTDRVDPDDGTLLSRGFLHTFGNVFQKAGWPWLAAAVLAYTLSPLFGAWRWRMLLKVQGIRLTFREAWRLTYIGFFFNTFLLGVTGGDVVKAYYAARHTTDRKTEAVTTVFLDRLIGILGLALLCVCALAFRWDDPAVIEVRTIILSFIGAAAGAGIVLYSRHVRRWLLLDKLCRKLPFRAFFAKLDAAVFVYRYHHAKVLWAVVLSWCAHVVSIASVCFSARALGLDASPHHFLIYMPVVWIAASILPSMGGLGPMEWLSQKYFGVAALGVATAEEAMTLAPAIILLFRAAMFLAVLPGGILNVLHPEVSVREAREQMEDRAKGDG